MQRAAKCCVATGALIQGRGRDGCCQPPPGADPGVRLFRAPVSGRTRSAFGVWGTHAAPIRGLAASVKYDLRVHIVWVPKYRKRVLTGPVAVRGRDLLRQIAMENDCSVW
jgi:hypothetical protein